LSCSFVPNPLSSTLSWAFERLVETGCIEVQTQTQIVLPFAVFTGQPQRAELRAIALEIDGANCVNLGSLDYAADLYPLVAAGKQNGDRGYFCRKE